MEATKQLKEDNPVGQSESRRHSHSRGRDRSRWHQVLSAQCPSRCLSPSPSPHDPILPTSSMKDFNLQTRPWKSRSRAWQDDTLTPAEKLKIQVRFEVEEDLGNDPMLPQGLTLFLVEDEVKEWNDTPGPFTPMLEDSPQLPLSETPSTAPPIQEEPGLKFQPSHLLAIPTPDPDQSQRNQIQLTTHVGGSVQRWSPTPTGGRN